jgi:hypothetical protein
MPTPTETLKSAIVSDGRPVYRIAREAGVSQAILWRFVNGKRGISGATLDRVCSVMQLDLSRRRRSA